MAPLPKLQTAREKHRVPKRFYFLTALIYLPIMFSLTIIHAKWYGFVLAGFSFALLLVMRHHPMWRGLPMALCFATAFLVAFEGLYISRPEKNVSLMGQIGREAVRFFVNLPVSEETRMGVGLSVIRSWEPPDSYEMEVVQLSHSSMELLARTGSQSPHAVLQLHGGAFVSGLNDLYRNFALRYCDYTGHGLVATLDYRLWPPYDFPSQQQDAMEAWLYLTETLGYAPENILLAGDSAGGNLVLSLCLQLRDQGKSLPGMLLCMSPWADLSNSGPSHLINATLDPTFGIPADRYDGSPVGVPVDYGSHENLQNPYISPAFGDYRGFPPMLLQASNNEVLLSDSQAIYENALQNGVDCTFTIYHGLFHVFQGSLDLVPESALAWDEIESFIQRNFHLEPSLAP